MSANLKRLSAWAIIGLSVLTIAWLWLPRDHYSGHHDMSTNHGNGEHKHDEVNMPGLKGLDATDEESAELAIMFRNFDKITRNVTNLPNGIRAVTHSSDPEIMDVLISHTTGMINRVEEGRDPQVFIQSKTLDILFEKRDLIETEIDVTDEGIIVIQTSTDEHVVEALQTHAGDVTDMADRGMQAVHEKMRSH